MKRYSIYEVGKPVITEYGQWVRHMEVEEELERRAHPLREALRIARDEIEKLRRQREIGFAELRKFLARECQTTFKLRSELVEAQRAARHAQAETLLLKTRLRRILEG